MDITYDQVQRLKEYPNVYYFIFPPEKIFHNRIRDWMIIKLSEEIGGGFLAGRAENMRNALIAEGVIKAIDDHSSYTPLTNETVLKEKKDVNVEIMMGYGYRHDEFDWNIAGTTDGTDPNILSELSWKDLIIHQVSLGLHVHTMSGLYMRNYFAYGVIVDGENQDSDYDEDDRQMEFSRSNNQADKGHTRDFSIGIGYTIPFNSDFFSLAPLIGYSYHRQELRMTDGYQTIPSLGSFPDLDSKYDATWQGPWVGLDFNLGLNTISRYLRFMEFCIGFEHHWAAYDATADWNLRTDFKHPKSFEHEADGQGDKFSIGLKNHLGKMTTFGIFYEQQQWTTQSGIDRVFLTTGQAIETRLNEVNWQSNVVRFEISIRF